MVTRSDGPFPLRADTSGPTLSRFEVSGLFGNFTNVVEFPDLDKSGNEPSLLILQGQNGGGKTTVLNMIAGVIPSLDFNPFRRFPFDEAEFEFSTGDKLTIHSTGDVRFPLLVKFRGLSAELSRDKDG